MNQRLFCYYGDDFTGSTDALEALAAHGVPAVLFLDPPDAPRLAEFPDCRAIGIAGESRSRDPEWMAEHLPLVFHVLRNYGAPVCQYKVCSTFDSSPHAGSIGRALEIGLDVFQSRCVPIVVTAPHLKRYVLFGNLFAAAGEEIYRIDRHPTMRCHPVTPMHESDLRLHLAQQTQRKIALLDLNAIRGMHADSGLDELLAHGFDAVLFDGLDASDLEETGRLLWTRRPDEPLFAIGSSGLTHALIYHWRKAGLIPGQFTPAPATSVEQVTVMSGSCSPVTESQIRWAMANGFAGIRIEPQLRDRDRVVCQALAALGSGSSVLVYTALGPGDCAGGAHGERLGNYLGELLRELLQRSGVRRVVIAGGDTSSHAVRRLGLHALTFAARLSPGAPLCRAHTDKLGTMGLELVLKGGQVGPVDFFGLVRKGNA